MEERAVFPKGELCCESEEGVRVEMGAERGRGRLLENKDDGEDEDFSGDDDVVVLGANLWVLLLLPLLLLLLSSRVCRAARAAWY